MSAAPEPPSGHDEPPFSDWECSSCGETFVYEGLLPKGSVWWCRDCDTRDTIEPPPARAQLAEAPKRCDTITVVFGGIAEQLLLLADAPQDVIDAARAEVAALRASLAEAVEALRDAVIALEGALNTRRCPRSSLLALNRARSVCAKHQEPRA